MNVYRIALSEYANDIIASGRKARWNSNGIFMVYAASSRALACLENAVHRSGEGLNKSFRSMVIHIPDDLEIAAVTRDELSMEWKNFDQQFETQLIGDEWVKKRQSAILKVPSAIIWEENNYLINPVHEDFSRIKLASVDPFIFDSRLAK